MSVVYGCVRFETTVKKEKHKRMDRKFPFIVVVAVKSGQYSATIENVEYIAHDNEVLIIPANILHDICMPVDSVISYAHIYARYIGEDVLCYYEVPFILKNEVAKSMFEHINSLAKVDKDSSILAKVTSDSLVSSMIKSILSYKDVKTRNSPEYLWGSKIRLYILQNITKKIKLSDLANYASLSNSSFSEKFKNVMGTSPIDYVIKTKIEYASAELLSGKSIKTIVHELGLCDEAYFSHLFKKHVGKSPRKYLEEYRKSF
ncbi:MAG: helix-turn-helix transcriptional regulator [Clostridia bacterium]|nr:helix-turn-helix transcriptional regulator [Clostridia bacterium]